MNVFLAGAAGTIGRQLLPMLLADGHTVWGTTRSPSRADWIRSTGATPVLMDAFDADGVRTAVASARPDVLIHELTDLARGFERRDLEANTRLRQLGTRNLVEAALAVGVGRLIAQGAGWLYAPRAAGPGSGEPLVETDPLLTPAQAPDDPVLPGILALEQLVLGASGFEGIVLRYGFLYGPGAAGDEPGATPSVHVAAAARAAALAVGRGEPGPYNIVDDGQDIANDRARTLLGWAPEAR
jgi:nucleoside-diphosphate-sugar epimerase